MGSFRNKNKKKRLHAKDFKTSRPSVWRQDADGANAAGGRRADDSGPGSFSTVLHNDAFEAYYKAQKIVPPEEWDAFLAALRRPLPLSFRVNGAGPFAASLTEELEAGLGGAWPKPGETRSLGPGEPDIPGPARLPWYPGGLAWTAPIPRGVLRKHPAMAAAHARLTAAHDGGRITRQEAVSMVPPLLLDVRPHHLVLDTCASPGSKTAQLLEMIHTDGGDGGDGGGRGRGMSAPTGAVVANDKDPSRCNMLAHQVARCPSPALVVTCHDAAFYPTPGAGGAGSTAAAVRFDRVLADVPCSGDGTLRKAVDLWRRWTPSSGVGLHPLQLRIAQRGAALLAVGGRMVYSTCSLNPVEDEAVVASLLAWGRGALVLVDVSSCLPGLDRAAGLHAWVVPAVRSTWEGPEGGGKKGRRGKRGDAAPTPGEAGPDGAAGGGDGPAATPPPVLPPLLSSWAEATALPGGPPAKLRESMFAPPAGEAAALHLERCARILPHPGDTGGFFVAVIEKVAELPRAGGGGSKEDGDSQEKEAVTAAAAAAAAAAPAPAPPAATTADDPQPPPSTAIRPSKSWGGADPVIEVDAAGPLTARLSEDYGLAATADGGGGGGSDAVPSPLASLVVRAVDGVAAPRRVFAVSPGVRRLLRADAGVGGRLKIVAAGVKVFDRSDGRGGSGGGSADGDRTTGGALRYRPASDGAALLARARPGKQLIEATPAEVLTLLEGRVVGLPASAKLGGAGGGEGGGRGGGGGAPPTATTSAPHPPALPTWADPDTCAAVAKTAHGGCIVALREPGASELGLPAAGPAAGLATAAWRGKASVSLSIPAAEAAARAAVLRRAMEKAGMEVPERVAFKPPHNNPPGAGGGHGEGPAAKKARAAEDAGGAGGGVPETVVTGA